MKINSERLDPPKQDVLKNAIWVDLNYRNVIFFINIIDFHRTDNIVVCSLLYPIRRSLAGTIIYNQSYQKSYIEKAYAFPDQGRPG